MSIQDEARVALAALDRAREGYGAASAVLPQLERILRVWMGEKDQEAPTDDDRIVIYANSNVTRGKYAAAAVHAALTAAGVHPGLPVIVLGAKPADIEHMTTVIHDAGRTEVEPGTVTAGTDWAGWHRREAPTEDEREAALAQALFRTLYDAGLSFESAKVIPLLTAAVRAAGWRSPALSIQGAPAGEEREALVDDLRRVVGHSPLLAIWARRLADESGWRRQEPTTPTAEDEVFLEHYTIGHARFGGLGGDIAHVTITREAWADLGEPETLIASVRQPTKGEDR